jgi:DNA-binding SARP family transcriptional activator
MPRAILAVLLLDANRTVPTERLISALWGDNPPQSAGASLYNHVARLRRSLGAAGVSRIRSVSAGYLVHVDDEELDLQVFTDLYRRGRDRIAVADWAGAAETLSTALALWKAAPLEGMPATLFFRAEARRLGELRLEAVRSRIEADLNLGHHERLIPELMALSVEHPLSEVFHGHLMLALYRSGRPSDALRVYRDIRGRLNGDLGVDPGPELADLHTRILQHDASLTRRPADARGRLPRTDATFRIPVPRQLPNDLIDFTGRDDTVRRLRSLLEPAEVPSAVVLSAVTGGAGVGKTTLALHVAHLVAAAFPDGQLYAELGDTGPIVRRPTDVLAGFLRELGVPDHEQPSDQEARAARFRTLLNGRRMLVVLDDARDADQIRPLLPGSGGCAVLITSRSRLPSLAGADHLDLDVLDEYDAHRMFTRIVGEERVGASHTATAAVLRYCAGLPLALRIAATRLTNRRSWTVATLAGRLSDQDARLDDITGALRASFDVSYARLDRLADGADVDLRRLFRRLALIPGPDFGVAEASAVLGGPWSDAAVRRALERLVDVHLVGADDAGRYRFHSLTRMYAQARADEDEPPVERDAALARLRSASPA